MYDSLMSILIIKTLTHLTAPLPVRHHDFLPAAVTGQIRCGLPG